MPASALLLTESIDASRSSLALLRCPAPPALCHTVETSASGAAGALAVERALSCVYRRRNAVAETVSAVTRGRRILFVRGSGSVADGGADTDAAVKEDALCHEGLTHRTQRLCAKSRQSSLVTGYLIVCERVLLRKPKKGPICRVERCPTLK